MSEQLRNFTYDEISIGQQASYSKRLAERDIQLFAAVSGDVNPVHLDAEFAATTAFGERIAHGMLTGAIISAALAMELPGPGTTYLSQSMRFRQPVKISDTVTVTLEVTDKQDRTGKVTIDCKARNQDDKLVASGIAEVMPPGESLRLARPAVPEFNPVG